MAVSIAKLAIMLTTDTSGMMRGFAQGESMATKFGNTISRMGLAVSAATFAALSASAAIFVREGLRMTATMETIRINLDTMTGSAARGKALLDEMWELAATTPFSFEEVAQGGKVLLALGVTASEVVPTLKFLGDVSAGTGQQVGQLAQVFGEVQNAGRLTSNELRQFNMRGIPLLGELADMFGVTKTRIREMVEAGEIGANDVTKAFQRMTSEGGRFFDLMDKQSKTLEGRWSTLKDSFSQLTFASVGGSGGWLNELMKDTTEWVESLTRGVELLKEAPKAMAAAMAFELSPLGGHVENPFLDALTGIQHQLDRAKELDKQLAEVGMFPEGPDTFERRADRARQSEDIAEKHEAMMKSLKKEAEDLARSLRNPGEVMAESMEKVNELFTRGLILPDMYGRAIEEIKNKFIDATKEKTRFFGGAGANPGVDFNTSAGASAIGAAKAEMARMVHEQKQSNVHLSKIEKAFSGVASF